MAMDKGCIFLTCSLEYKKISLKLLIGVEGATSWGLARAENPIISGPLPK